MIEFLNQFSQRGGDEICYNLDILSEFINKTNQDFAQIPELKLLFSLKANSNIEVLTHMAALNVGADCASFNEIKLAEKAGFNFISATGPGFENKEIDYMITNNVKFDFDNLQQLYKYENGCKDIGLRIRLKEYDSRFGLDIGNENIRKYILKCGYKIRRLHFHFGNKDVTQLKKLLESIVTILQENGNVLKNVETLNLGGGIESIYSERRESEMIDILQEFQKKVSGILGRSVYIMLEPGSLLALPFGFLKSRVLSINDQSAVMSVSAYNLSTWHPCKPLFHHGTFIHNNTDIGTDYKYVLTGCSCYELDYYGEFSFLHEIHADDRIIFYPVGAYNVNLCRSLHCLPLPQLVIYKGGKFYEKK